MKSSKSQSPAPATIDKGGRKYGIAVIVVVCLAAFFRVLIAYRGYYDPEEFAHALTARSGGFFEFMKAAKELMIPYLDVFLLRFIFDISDSELFVRIVYVVQSLIFIIVAYFVSCGILKSRFAGFLTALIVAFAPMHVFYSQIIRYHNLVCIFSALSIYSLYLVVFEERPKARYFMAYGLSTALGLMTHYYVFFLIAAQGIAFLSIHWNRPIKWMRFVWGQCFTLLFFAPWMPTFFYHLNANPGTVPPSFSLIAREFAGRGTLNIADAFFGFVLGDYYDIHNDAIANKILLFAAVSAIGSCAVILTASLAKKKRDTEKFLIALALAAALIPFALRPMTAMAYHPKFMLPFSIVFYMLLACAVEKTKGAPRIAVATALVLAVAGSLMGLIAATGGEPTIKTVSKKIGADLTGGGILVASSDVCAEIFTEYSGAHPKIHFVSEVPAAGLIVGERVGETQIRETEKVVRGRGEVWLFYCLLKRADENTAVARTDEDKNSALLTWFLSNMKKEQVITFKISPRKMYFIGRAYRFTPAHP